MVSGVAIPVVSTNSLLTQSSVTQLLVSDALEPKLAIQKQKLYKRWVLKRDLTDDDSDPIYTELLKLSQDIQGSYYTFYSGLSVKAQDQIETMLQKYQLQ